MQYVIRNNENLFDVAVKLYGTSEYTVKLVNENSSLSFTDLTIAGIEVEFDETIKSKNSQASLIIQTIIPTPSNEVEVKSGQSIYDLSIMLGYGMENIISFVNLAGLDNINQLRLPKKISVTKVTSNLTKSINLQRIVLSTSVTMTGTPVGGSFDNSFDNSFD